MTARPLLKWLAAPALIILIVFAIVVRPDRGSAPAGAQEENAMAVDAVSGGSVDPTRTVSGATPFDISVRVTAAPVAYVGYQGAIQYDGAVLEWVPVTVNEDGPTVAAAAGDCHDGIDNDGNDDLDGDDPDCGRADLGVSYRNVGALACFMTIALDSAASGTLRRTKMGAARCSHLTTFVGEVVWVRYQCKANGQTNLHLLTSADNPASFSTTAGAAWTIIPTTLTDATITCGGPDTRPRVVLVHGWDQNSDSASCGMEPLAGYIGTPANMGGHSFKTECLWYRTREGVVAAAVALKQKIDGLGRDKVDIVAHSMGGLVARYYIERLGGRNKVRSLTMLGTPNWGTAFAIAACDYNWVYLLKGGYGKYDQAACDLIPLSPIILKLNFNPGSHAGVSYNVITGNVGNWLLQRPNDCMVPVASAQGLSFPTTVRGVSHVKMSGPLGCTATGEMDDAGVRNQIRDILLASNGFAPLGAQPAAEVAASPMTAPDEPAPDALAWRNGLIADGDTVELPITMPDGQASGTFVFQSPSSTDVALAYSLLRPDGTPVEESDPDVSFVAGPAFGDFDETQYVISNPTVGLWIMRVVGTSVPVGGWPFELRALVPGRISVVASAGAGHYDTGEPIALEGDVAIAGTPVADATVNATVTKPDGTPAVVALVGDGSGAYTGGFGDTSACGMYQVLVTASGTDGSTPFTREDRTVAVVGIAGNAILNPCNADSDGDGLTDEQEIETYSTNPAAADTDSDGVNDGVEISSLLTDPSNPDTDADGCADGEEPAGAAAPKPGATGAYDPLDSYDVYDVPVPALADPSPNGPRNQAVDIADVLGVLFYAFADEGGPANANGVAYDSDKMGLGTKAGRFYDRTPGTDPNPPWDAGPPNGVIDIGDVLAVLAQFGLDCSGPP